MHRLVRFATVTSLALAASLAHAQAPDASAPMAAGTPLANGLEALRTSDYARATQTLSAIHGADGAAAQVALARAMLATGRYDTAEQTARRAGGTTAEKLAAVCVRAEALFRMGKVADAIKLLEGNEAGTGSGPRRVRLLLGEYRIASGHRADADDPLMKIVEEYNDGTIANSDAEGLAMVGRAAHLLRSPKDANAAFNESERAGKRVETLAWRAELFSDKYDPGHAGEVLGEGSPIAPHDPSCSSQWRA